MELRGIANRVSSIVNPNKVVTVRRSAGYTISASGQKQIPKYAPDVTGPGQVQALDGQDLKQMDGLNIQGVIRAIYLKGVLAGVVQPKGQGGDLIIIDGEVWLVVKVLESWPTWTKAAIQYQGAQ